MDSCSWDRKVSCQQLWQKNNSLLKSIVHSCGIDCAEDSAGCILMPMLDTRIPPLSLQLPALHRGVFGLGCILRSCLQPLVTSLWVNGWKTQPCAPHVVPETKIGRAMLVAYMTNGGRGGQCHRRCCAGPVTGTLFKRPSSRNKTRNGPGSAVGPHARA